MKINFPFLSIVLLFIFSSCSEDDSTNTNNIQFVAAFENQSISFTDTEDEKVIKLVFSETAAQNGVITINYTENNLSYSTDFTTTPSAENGSIEIAYQAGEAETSFTFNKLTENPREGESEKSIEFYITDVTNGTTQGNTNLLVNFSEAASLGGSVAPTIGGPNEGNQVYIDLSAQTETIVARDKWDLAFYSGEEFRVKLNNSLFMMAAELNTNNIDEITEADVEDLQAQMQLLQAGSDVYVDNPNGTITGTAINEISSVLDENKVYLINMGNEVGTDTPETGSVAVAGDSRGWKKIKVTLENDTYVLQYANLNETTHQQQNISKTPDYNFTFFSIITESIVDVEPLQSKWDLNFTVFTEVLELNATEYTAYGFSDYVATNVLANTNAYQVTVNESINYSDFSIEDVDESLFELDQRVIGSNWRDVFNHSVETNLFYIVKDPEGNIYKLRFTALVNENGVRGYPTFEYNLLNL